MRGRYELLHRIGVAPWAGGDIPLQLREIAQRLYAGEARVAVDLGCGTGEHARYLAGAGWSVTAVDFVPTAISAARRADPEQIVDWRVADVTRPDQVDPGGVLAGTVHLVLDVGCLHGLALRDRPGWGRTVGSLMAPAATLLVRAAPAGQRWPAPAGIDGPDVARLLGPGWELVRGHSGWYEFARQDQ